MKKNKVDKSIKKSNVMRIIVLITAIVMLLGCLILPLTQIGA